MEMKIHISLVKFTCSLLLFAVLNCSALQKGGCFWAPEDDGCLQNQFRCGNGTCIDRQLFCNGDYDCNDNSDEDCEFDGECESTYFRECELSEKCIPAKWFCDGVPDCWLSEDEICKEEVAKEKALNWLKSQRVYRSTTDVWGSTVDRIAVAFYLGDSSWRHFNDGTRSEMAYELSIQLLSRLSQEKLKDIPSNDLASYINAFLVTCLNPRNFHGHDIVEELRSRVGRHNYTNPYLLLALCNAGDTMSEKDIDKLLDVYSNKRRSLWTDIKALVVMALACISRNNDDLKVPILSYFMEELWIEATDNMQTKALVMQALISIGSNSLFKNTALQKAVTGQISDGSFGNIINTYYMLPVLNCESLADISSDHCKTFYKNDTLTLGDTDIQGPLITISYSVRLGYDGAFTRTFALKVPNNMTLFELIQYAAVLDDHRLEYAYHDGKPYINAVDREQDDPEKGKFWFLYNMLDDKPVIIHESPADIILEDGDSYILWYHDEIWTN